MRIRSVKPCAETTGSLARLALMFGCFSLSVLIIAETIIEVNIRRCSGGALASMVCIWSMVCVICSSLMPCERSMMPR